MALTDAGKAYVMNNDMKTATLYVGLSGAHAGVSDQSAINEASGARLRQESVACSIRESTDFPCRSDDSSW